MAAILWIGLPLSSIVSPPQDAIQVCFTLRCSQKCELTLTPCATVPCLIILTVSAC